MSESNTNDEFGAEFRDTSLRDRETLDEAFAAVQEPDSEVELTKGGSRGDDDRSDDDRSDDDRRDDRRVDEDGR